MRRFPLVLQACSLILPAWPRLPLLIRTLTITIMSAAARTTVMRTALTRALATITMVMTMTRRAPVAACWDSRSR
jgi:hypothetical protein